MKKAITLLTILFLTGQILAQLGLTGEKWREDLKFLQETVHEDYSFLFRKISAEDFDKEVNLLHDKIPGYAEHEIIAHLGRLVSLFGYGHTSLPLSGWFQRDQYNFRQAEVHLKDFSDGVFVQGCTKDNRNALGSKVVAVAGKPIDEVIRSVRPFFPAENEQFFRAYGMPFLTNLEILHAAGVTSENQNNLTLTLEKNGQKFDHTFNPIEQQGFPGSYTYVQSNDQWIEGRDTTETPLYLKNFDRHYYYEFLEESNALYIRYSQVMPDPQEDIQSFFGRAFSFIEENEVDKLILDVRLNGGGNNYNNKTVVTGLIKSRVNRPGKTFVIIDGQTYSACQNLVNELSNYTEAIFVGQPTGENINFYGDNNRVVLPNSEIPVRLSFAWWQDKPQWEDDEWLAPHLSVDMSYQQYANNEDPAIQKALDFEDDQFVLDPMGYLSNLYQTGQMMKLQLESQRIIKDPNYEFFDFEGEFNRLGYQLLGRGDANTAVAVFRMITALFPESANACDSLAEGLWKSGDKEQAKEWYEKAIAMDPDGTVGSNARKMLKEMAKED